MAGRYVRDASVIVVVHVERPASADFSNIAQRQRRDAQRTVAQAHQRQLPVLAEGNITWSDGTWVNSKQRVFC